MASPTQKWARRRELQNGSLVRLLPEWKTRDIGHAYFPAGRATAPQLGADRFPRRRVSPCQEGQAEAGLNMPIDAP
jgi:hypothetical protein